MSAPRFTTAPLRSSNEASALAAALKERTPVASRFSTVPMPVTNKSSPNVTGEAPVKDQVPPERVASVAPVEVMPPAITPTEPVSPKRVKPLPAEAIAAV